MPKSWTVNNWTTGEDFQSSSGLEARRVARLWKDSNPLCEICLTCEFVAVSRTRFVSWAVGQDNRQFTHTPKYNVNTP